MAKEKTKKDIEEINVGVVGHIDHGKTTLLKALSGTLADTHSEELKRGITIKLGYAGITISKDEKEGYNIKDKGEPKRYVSFVDAPGHEMLMATMLSGAAIMDAAILVIAANEGIKPQTREHFMALQSKKINNIIVIQNKIDLVSKEQAIENHKEIQKFLKQCGYENSPIIPVSAQQQINTDKILEEICKVEIPERNTEDDPIFLVARSFDINRPGKKIEKLNGGVLGGILKKGKLKKGDKIEIKPGITVKEANQIVNKTLETEILSLHKGDEEVEEVIPGASISIETNLDPSLTKTDALIGNVVAIKGNLPEISRNIKIKAELFKEIYGEQGHHPVEQIKTKEMLMLNINTTTTVGTVEKVDKKTKDIELSLNIPVIALPGDKLGIARNHNSHWRLIGHGEVIE